MLDVSLAQYTNLSMSLRISSVDLTSLPREFTGIINKKTQTNWYNRTTTTHYMQSEESCKDCLVPVRKMLFHYTVHAGAPQHVLAHMCIIRCLLGHNTLDIHINETLNNLYFKKRRRLRHSSKYVSKFKCTYKVRH